MFQQHFIPTLRLADGCFHQTRKYDNTTVWRFTSNRVGLYARGHGIIRRDTLRASSLCLSLSQSFGLWSEDA